MKKEEQVKAVKKALKANYKKLVCFPGVKEVGYGYKYRNHKRTRTIAIIVSVGRKAGKKDVPLKSRIPGKIGNIPVDVIEMHSWDHVFQDPYKQCNPLSGGISISEEKFTGSGGTMGAIVFENGTEKPMGLTNHHVLFHKRLFKKSKKGDAILQPAFSDEDIQTNIGTLARGDDDLDCAVFYLNNSRPVEAMDTLNGFAGKITGFAEPEPGTKLKKTGAKTQMTFGIVDHVFSDYFTIAPNPNKPAPNNQISDSGDSGAVWVTDTNENIAIGLHNRGETGTNPGVEWGAAIKISKVLTAMNVHF